MGETRILRTNLSLIDMVADIVFQQESYDLVGCAYAVYNELKYGYHEKYYQKAYEIELLNKGFQFARELKVDLSYGDQKIGNYYLDFLVNNQIVVEFKVANDFHINHIKQVFAYLKATDKRLGIIILFTQSGIKYKRIVN